MGPIGSSQGWVAALKDGNGRVLLCDDINPVASDTDSKRITLPPRVTLPHCQTQFVTSVSMSSSSPEDEDCVVAVKFLGPQLSFCRPAQSNSEWINIKIENPCFSTSQVMFSKKYDFFGISGDHLVGTWDASTHNPEFYHLEFRNLPNLTKAKRDLLHSCCRSDHLVESQSTEEYFLIRWYRKTTTTGTVRMKTKALMVFKIDKEGNAIYTQDIGDLCIFLSKSEPFCVPASSFPPGMPQLLPNHLFSVPYFIPPQNIVK